MRKMNLVTVMVVAALVMFGSKATAQEKFLSFGVKLDANLSDYGLSGMSGTSSSFGIRGVASGFAKINVNQWFAIQPEIGIYNRVSTLENKTAGMDVSYNAWGFEAPVYALFQTNVGSGKVYAGVGPYAGYGIKAKAGGQNMFSGGSASLERFDYGAAALVGYEFSKGWQINAGYRRGLANALKNGGGASMKNQMITLGLGYRF